MITKKILLYIGLAFVLTGNHSCSDFLDEVPKSFVSTENFYQSEYDALASLYSVYDKLGTGTGVYWRWYRYITLYPSDEGWANPNNNDYKAINDYSYDSRNIVITQLWQFTYDGINRANATIDNVSLMDMDESKKNQIVGEARFLRALNYFNLVRLYGPVPLRLSETKSLNDIAIAASSIEDIYQAILDDLSFAEQHMIIRQRGTADANGRADLAAAKMLLAKVYMTMAGYPLNDNSKWPLALQKAKEIYEMRDEFGFGLWDNYLDVFEPQNENGKEDIFSIQFKAGYGAAGAGEGSLQNMDNFLTTAGRRGAYNDRPTLKLKQMFEAGDERGGDEALPNYRTVNGVKYYMPANSNQFLFMKYVEQDVVDNNLPTNDTEKNFPLYRYADLLLMLAECENEVNGTTSMAYEWLNTVRARSGASEVAGLSKEAFREFVLDERMRELYNEGSRWFDLVRYQRLIEEVTEAHNISPSQIPNIPTEKNYWLPYPLTELNFNPNLHQREGY